MEGRWAQLTLDAHIAKAIDYRLPVKPFIENLILDRMALNRRLNALSLYPLGDDGNQVMLDLDWVEKFKRYRIEPWLGQKEEQTDTTSPLQQRIEYLKQVKKEYEVADNDHGDESK